MHSAIAILTWNRVGALKTLLDSYSLYKFPYPVAIFDDMSTRDGAQDYLIAGRKPHPHSLEKEILADQWVGENPTDPIAFLGTRNLGVAGNSNRAIRWFQSLPPQYTHLCLLNDDLIVTGDFVAFYEKAHRDLKVGHFAFCDFTGEDYRWVLNRVNGYNVKILPRMTGIMMSFTRECLNKIGYYDAQFRAFGNEHCDMTIRARIGGFVQLAGVSQNCLDVDHRLLRHQEVETSMQGDERARADADSERIMHKVSQEYAFRPIYRPFVLDLPVLAGGRDGGGIPVEMLPRYTLIDGRP